MASTVKVSPRAPLRRTRPGPRPARKPACSATMSCTRARPWARFAHTKLSDVGEGRGAADECDRQVHREDRGGRGKVLLHEHRRGGALHQPQGQAPEDPTGGSRGGRCLRQAGWAGRGEWRARRRRSLIRAADCGSGALTSSRALWLIRCIRLLFALMSHTASLAPSCAAPAVACRGLLLLVIPVLPLLTERGCGALANA